LQQTAGSTVLYWTLSVGKRRKSEKGRKTKGRKFLRGFYEEKAVTRF
jgi:hypothetical protein